MKQIPIKDCLKCGMCTTRVFQCPRCGDSLPLTQEEQESLSENKKIKRRLRKARKLINARREIPCGPQI